MVTNDDYELGAIIGNERTATGVAHGDLLVRFTETVLGASEDNDASGLRTEIINALGAAAFVDTCATVASFNAVVKIADGTGIPLESDKAERTFELRAEVGINQLQK